MVEIKNLNYMRRHSKLDIFKYALASYAVIPFSKIFVHYELDDTYKNEYISTDKFIMETFNDAKKISIHHKRINSAADWRQAVHTLNQEPDELIWFTCNDDHIFILLITVCL